MPYRSRFQNPWQAWSIFSTSLAISSSRSADERKGSPRTILRGRVQGWAACSSTAKSTLLEDGPSREETPYLDSIRLDIQSNRENELLRFRRGELHFIDNLEPELFARLQKDMPKAVVDAGPSLDSEFLWFNQVADGSYSRI